MAAKKNISGTVATTSFADLKKLITRRRIEKARRKAPTSQESPLSDEELFLHTMRGVCEIEEFRRIPLTETKVPLPKRRKSSDSEAMEALADIAAGRRPVHLPDTQEYVAWIDGEYCGEIIEDLHQGRYSVQACLDLHGAVLDEADAAVGDFIKESVRQGRRCIKIIHGRGLCSPGGPVLKKALVTWLSRRHRKHVFAFVTARQCDGGLGALYVLLKP
ncbi:MAG: Smr/MutS family protein [Nitrospiraceae bacterium]|nr:MAG: Smr/MutS family protein [Nitrospiraceae bacterium]